MIGVFNKSEKSSIDEIIVNKLTSSFNKIILKKDTKGTLIKDGIIKDNEYCIIKLTRKTILESHTLVGKFDIIVFGHTDPKCIEPLSMEEISKIIRPEGYLIFNSELLLKLNFQCYEIYPITFGLNGRNTITASSIDVINGLNFSFCVQRAIKTITNTIVEPCEIPVNISGGENVIEDYLAAYTVLILLGFLY